MENSKSLSRNMAVSGTSKHGWWLLPVAVVLAASVYAFNADAYLAYLITSWVIFGLLAFSLDLVWGKGGDLSLGHTVFFGLGAYVYGIAAINLAPIVGNTYLLALLFGAITGAIVAGVIGYFIFYGRLGPLQTTIITYTSVLLMATLAVSLTFKFGNARVGGANGMTGIPPLSLEILGLKGGLSRQQSLVATLVATLGVVLGALYLLRQPFGLIIAGIRQDPLKTELLGYDVRRYKLVLFAISGAIAGIAGALFAAWSAYVSPSLFGVVQALLIPIYVLVGGLGSLYGAFIGALFIGWLTFWLGGGAGGGQTTLILGVVLVLIVLFAPKGILGLLQRVVRPRPSTPTPAEALPASDVSTLATIFESDTERRVLLETVNLKKRFGGVVATDDVSLQFYSKGIHCLIGPNGAGKSTYLNTCTGLIKPDSGQILLDGVDIARTEPFERVRRGMGIKLQVAKVLEEQTVHENLWLAAYSKSRNRAHAGRLVAQILDVIGLKDKANTPASELAHGQQQWLDIGMVLCLEPKIIFLDEPAAGMTAVERKRTVEILRTLSQFIGVVVVEHDMEFIRELDAPVTVLHQGAVFANGTIDELRQNDDVLDIYLGRQKNA